MGDNPVLIVDEAQGLPRHLLEEIRMLLNLETRAKSCCKLCWPASRRSKSGSSSTICAN